MFFEKCLNMIILHFRVEHYDFSTSNSFSDTLVTICTYNTNDSRVARRRTPGFLVPGWDFAQDFREIQQMLRHQQVSSCREFLPNVEDDLWNACAPRLWSSQFKDERGGELCKQHCSRCTSMIVFRSVVVDRAIRDWDG